MERRTYERKNEQKKTAEPVEIQRFFGAPNEDKSEPSTSACILRNSSASFAEQNGRDAELSGR